MKTFMSTYDNVSNYDFICMVNLRTVLRILFSKLIMKFFIVNWEKNQVKELWTFSELVMKKLIILNYSWFEAV